MKLIDDTNYYFIAINQCSIYRFTKIKILKELATIQSFTVLGHEGEACDFSIENLF
jgi:hypothetical protein